MEIKLYNSLSNKIEVFHPLHEGEVTCYVCGPTVYNYVHVGNMRPVVVFDVLRRLFLYLGYKVTFISNFTDIDDKIINNDELMDFISPYVDKGFTLKGNLKYLNLDIGVASDVVDGLLKQ